MTTPKPSNRPSHTVFMVEGEKDNATWTEIGALWAHAKGNGFNLNLKVVPFSKDARLVVLPRKDKEQPKQEVGA